VEIVGEALRRVGFQEKRGAVRGRRRFLQARPTYRKKKKRERGNGAGLVSVAGLIPFLGRPNGFLFLFFCSGSFFSIFYFLFSNLCVV
jgi:hypothetical protein